jgi:hypothetical protein
MQVSVKKLLYLTAWDSHATTHFLNPVLAFLLHISLPIRVIMGKDD